MSSSANELPLWDLVPGSSPPVVVQGNHLGLAGRRVLLRIPWVSDPHIALLGAAYVGYRMHDTWRAVCAGRPHRSGRMYYSAREGELKYEGHIIGRIDLEGQSIEICYQQVRGYYKGYGLEKAAREVFGLGYPHLIAGGAYSKDYACVIPAGDALLAIPKGRDRESLFLLPNGYHFADGTPVTAVHSNVVLPYPSYSAAVAAFSVECLHLLGGEVSWSPVTRRNRAYFLPSSIRNREFVKLLRGLKLAAHGRALAHAIDFSTGQLLPEFEALRDLVGDAFLTSLPQVGRSRKR